MQYKNYTRWPVEDMPPPEIIEAAQKVALWFKERGIDSWSLGDIQSRNDEDETS